MGCRLSSSKASLLGVLLLSAALQLPLYDRSVVPLDEGQLLAIGARMLSGDVLYRDIYTGIFPGIYWLAASLLGLFGVDLQVLRFAQLVVNSLTATGLFLLARPLATASVAWMAPFGYLALVALSFPVFSIFSYSSLALLAAIGAALAGRRFVLTASLWWGALAGVLLAASVIFKQNYGAFALMASGISALWTGREGALARESLAYRFLYPATAGLLVAAAAVTLLAATGAWPTFVEYTFFTIFESQAEAFNQPMPPIFGPHPVGDGKFLFLYGPGGLFGAMIHGRSWATPTTLSLAARLGYGSALLALALLPVLAWRFAVHGNDEERIAARFALPLAGLMFLGMFPSAIWSHLASVYPPLLVVLATSWSAAAMAVRGRSVGLHLAMTAAGLCALSPIAAAAVGVTLDIHRSYTYRTPLPAMSVHISARDAKLYEEADDFLRRCAPEGTPVFVAPDMPLLYVTSGRRNPTPYDLIIPGDVRDGLIVDTIDRAGVNCMVFNPTMYAQFAPFETLFPQLYGYMSTHFKETGSTSQENVTWRFLERRGQRR